MWNDVANKTVLVVGGSSGIGLATARAAVELEADVTIASHDPARLRQAGETLSKAARTLVVDTNDNGSILKMFSETGPFDFVIVSAATTKGGPVRQLPLEDAYASMNSKFWGAYRVARAAKINQGGSLTLVSGFLSQRPSAGAVLQGAINAALEGLVRGLALEFAPVRVNAVSPGLIDTPLYSKLSEEQRRQLYEETRQQLPVDRIGNAEDVAKAALFVATNSFVTGSVVTIDGGGTIA